MTEEGNICVCLFLSVCARMCEPKRTDERTHINTHINPPPQPTYTYTNHHYHPRTHTTHTHRHTHTHTGTRRLGGHLDQADRRTLWHLSIAPSPAPLLPPRRGIISVRVCVCVCVSVCLSVCLSVCVSHTHTHTHTETLILSKQVVECAACKSPDITRGSVSISTAIPDGFGFGGQ